MSIWIKKVDKYINEHTKKIKRILLICFIVFVYISSLCLYKDQWVGLINYVWVDPIAGKFNPDNFGWKFGYGGLILFIIGYYSLIILNERKVYRLRQFFVGFLFSEFLFYSLTQGNFVFNGLYTWGLILLPVISEVIICIRCSKESQPSEARLKNDQPLERTKEEIKKDAGLKRSKYVEHTADLLKTEFFNKSSFAIGITGKWGSGKTTFTNDLRTLMRDDVDVIVDFQAWFCKTPNDILDDFFIQYSSAISQFVPELTTRLKLYKASLESIEFSHSNINLTLKNLIAPKSTSQLYKDIQESLEKAKVKVVVIIDDLDRLHRDEILEVLRLVRNTANFPYTQFIVAYHKEYILKTLDDNTKIDYNDYLSKIFNLEIALPAYESHILCDELYANIKEILDECEYVYLDDHLGKIVYERIDMTMYQREMDDGKGNILLEPKYYENTGVYFIPQILQSFRDIIRFSNSFKLNFTSIKGCDISIHEIDYSNFLYLELIRYKFVDIYELLKDNPLTLLHYNINENKYQMEALYKTMEKVSNKSELILSRDFNGKYNLDYVFLVLDKLFSEKNVSKVGLINNSNSYFTYFANRVDERNISIAEFLSLLTQDFDVALQRMESWYEKEEKNFSQIKEKLFYFLDVFTTKNREVDVKQVHDLTKYVFENTQSLILKEEIRACLISYFVNNSKIIDDIDKADIRLSFVYFWINFSDLIKSETNQNILYTIITTDNLSLKDNFRIYCSAECQSLQMIKAIYNCIIENSATLENDFDDLVSIQKDILNNYYLSINTVDSKIIDGYRYCNSTSTYNILWNDERKYKDTLKYQFMNYIIKFPSEFINSNLLIEEELISFKLSMIGILDKETLIAEFEESLRLNFNESDEYVRAMNLWSLFKVRNFDPIVINLFEKNHQYETDNFQIDVENELAALNILNEYKEKKQKIDQIDNDFIVSLKIKDLNEATLDDVSSLKYRLFTNNIIELHKLAEKIKVVVLS